MELKEIYISDYHHSSAGTDRSYKCTGRRAVGLGTTKALYCRCAHYTVLSVHKELLNKLHSYGIEGNIHQ
jgi:hypothetical protein